MTMLGKDGYHRYLVDRHGVAIEDDYVGPAVRHDEEGPILVMTELHPLSAAIVKTLVVAADPEPEGTPME